MLFRSDLDGTTRPAKDIGKVSAGPKSGGTVPAESVITEIEQCGTQITPICLQALYKMPTTRLATLGTEKNSYGIGIDYRNNIFIPANAL